MPTRQPVRPAPFLQQNGHPGMDRRKRACRRRRQQCETALHIPGAVAPGRPETGQRQHRAIFAYDRERTPPPRGLSLPFIKSIRRHDTAALHISGPEHSVGDHIFDPRIDRPHLAGRRRAESPAQPVHSPNPGLRMYPHCPGELRWRHVEPRPAFPGHFHIVQKPMRAPGIFLNKPSTHTLSLTKKFDSVSAYAQSIPIWSFLPPLSRRFWYYI